MRKGQFLFMIDVPWQRVEKSRASSGSTIPMRNAEAPNRKSRLFHDLPHARLNGPG